MTSLKNAIFSNELPYKLYSFSLYEYNYTVL